jgi:outer membrane protein
MKKLNLILESILLVAVIVLFVLFFNQKPSSGSEEPSVATEWQAAANGDIVVVKIDSLMRNYQMYLDLSTELQEKTKKIDAELENKLKKFQKDVADFQNKAQKGLETRVKLAEMEQQLTVDQQALGNLRDSYALQMQEEEQVMYRKCLQSIMDYLTEYNKDKGFRFILGSSFGSNVLYSEPSLDHTTAVIAGINAQYVPEAAQKK